MGLWMSVLALTFPYTYNGLGLDVTVSGKEFGSPPLLFPYPPPSLLLDQTPVFVSITQPLYRLAAFPLAAFPGPQLLPL